jgi:PEP-CTERM motif
VLAGTTYGFDHPGFPNDPNRLLVVDTMPTAAGIHGLALFLASPMTNAGGVIALGAPPFGTAKGIEGLCVTAGCFGLDPFRMPTAGEVQGAVVPEPAAVLLVALGAAAAAIRRQRRAKTERGEAIRRITSA